MEDGFLDFLLTPQSGLEQLPIDKLDEILEIATTPWERNVEKIQPYYDFITYTTSVIEKIPKQNDKDIILKNLHRLKQLLDTYTTGPLLKHHEIMNSVKKRLKVYNLYGDKKEIVLNNYKTFIQEVLTKLPTLPDDRKKQTIIINIKRIEHDLEQLKSGQIKNVGRKIKDYKFQINRILKKFENYDVNRNKNIAAGYYEFIKNVKQNELPLIKEEKHRKILNIRLNKLKLIVSTYEQDPTLRITNLPKNPSVMKHDIMRRIKQLLSKSSSS